MFLHEVKITYMTKCFIFIRKTREVRFAFVKLVIKALSLETDLLFELKALKRACNNSIENHLEAMRLVYIVCYCMLGY